MGRYLSKLTDSLKLFLKPRSFVITSDTLLKQTSFLFSSLKDYSDTYLNVYFRKGIFKGHLGFFSSLYFWKICYETV